MKEFSSYFACYFRASDPAEYMPQAAERLDDGLLLGLSTRKQTSVWVNSNTGSSTPVHEASGGKTPCRCGKGGNDETFRNPI